MGHICKCGCELDRDTANTTRPDHNAAINIVNSALGTVGHTETWIKDPNASGDSSATALGVKPDSAT